MFIIRIYTCFLLLMSINFGIIAQVGINTENPSSLSVLDIRNVVNTVDGVKDTIPQGIFIPRLSQAKIEAIDVTNQEEANSLLLYNIDEDCYNYFSKTKKSWISLCGGNSSITNSVFTIDCANVTVSGLYEINHALNTSNYLTLQVTVTKPGSFTITATSTNGYYFSKSGEFLSTGTYPIRLDGAGTPIAEGQNTIPIINTSTSTGECSVIVNVVKPDSQYSLLCDSTKVSGTYQVGQALSNTNTIQLYVNVSTIGGWSIESNTVDGISFAGSGTFTKTGSQWLTVTGKGTPLTDTSKKMTLLVQSSSNDGSASAFCTAIIKMTLNSKSLGSIGQGTYLLASPQLGSSSTNISAMFRNHYNFGTQEYSTVKMKDPTYYNILYSNTDRFGISASSLSGIITRGGVARDALFISYNTGLADQAAADTFTNYIQQGGVVVLLSSQVLSTDRPSYLTDAKSVITLGTGNLALMQNLFGPQVTPVLSTFNPRDVWKLPMAANNDKIFNGPFGDIRNQYIQAGATVYSTTGSSTSNYGVVGVSYDGIPINKLDWVINATNNNADNVAISSNIVGFKASGYNFIWFADPSLFTYIRYNTGELDAANTCGLEVIGYKPVDLSPNSGGNSSKFTTVNSKFLANLLAWAMEQAEYNGINSK